MAKIRQPVLKLLERLYGFVGAQDGAPSEVELGLGITPVHDMSRMAELGAAKVTRGSAGFWIATCTNTHTSVADIETVMNFVNPGASNEGWSLDESKEWIWIMDAWATATGTVADFLVAQMLTDNITNDFFVGPSQGNASNNPDSVSQVFFHGLSIVTNGSLTRPVIPDIPFPTNPIPILSPQDGVRFESRPQGTGNIVIHFNLLIWVGPRGVMPPGMS